MYGKLRRPCSQPARIRYAAAGTTPSRKMPEAKTIVDTWMMNQYDWSAGISGATCDVELQLGERRAAAP